MCFRAFEKKIKQSFSQRIYYYHIMVDSFLINNNYLQTSMAIVQVQCIIMQMCDYLN